MQISSRTYIYIYIYIYNELIEICLQILFVSSDRRLHGGEEDYVTAFFQIEAYICFKSQPFKSI